MSSVEKSTSIPELIARWRNLGERSGAENRAGGAEALDAETLDALPVEVAAERRTVARDPLDCLKDMLRAAVKLEFATIPPYLTALWSIKNDLHPAARSIREVVQEEMLHLALTCNLLASLGEAPDLCAWAPRYPGPLPGDVHHGLEVGLRGLDDESLRAFVRIESPASLPENVEREPDDPHPQGGDTIGELYESILAAFRHIRPRLSVDGQVTGPLSWKVIATLGDVEGAIRLIQRQGEGAILGPRDSGEADLAHYYRFLEVLKRKRLVFDKARRMYVWHKGYDRPDVWPMGPVPRDGYSNAALEVTRLLDRFDRTYSKMLDHLNRAWQPAGQGELIRAIDLMFELERSAKPLMQMPIPGGCGQTYGPRFRYGSSSKK